MNVEVRQVQKTAAEQAFARAYDEARERLPGGEGVSRLRAAAFGTFAMRGLPTRRVEEWKYTDLRALIRDGKPLAGPPDAKAIAAAKMLGGTFKDIEARRLVFLNGAFMPALSDLADLEHGLTIASLAQALADGDAAVITRLSEPSPQPADVALALNTAFMGDGAVIRVAPGVSLARPLHLVFRYAGDPAASFVRSIVDVGAGARLALLESHTSAEDRDDQANVALDLTVADDAHVDIVKAGLQSRRAIHLASLVARVGARARFNSFTFTTGGAVTRNQLFIRCEGIDANLRMGGASLLRGRQHADTTLLLDHAAPGGQSRETFKSVLDGASRGVFQGKIIVRPHAQKTDARMMTRALLLSEEAESDNKPELEIFADDVQCGHGATAGTLDEQLKFYLMTRGLPEHEAEALLIQAFIGDAVEGIEHAGLREALMDAATAWLAQRGAP